MIAAHPVDNPYPYESLASWFYDAGATACGFHATNGVANKYLRCGARITFEHRGRVVTAVVEDRGPYIAGRDWDLNPNTRAVLDCPGLCVVRWRYGGPPPARWSFDGLLHETLN